MEIDLALLADAATIDGSGKLNILGVFDRISALTWTILPALLMVVVGVVTVAGIVDLGRAPSDDSLRVDVTGQRFSWLFEYPNLQDGEGNALEGAMLLGLYVIIAAAVWWGPQIHG